MKLIPIFFIFRETAAIEDGRRLFALVSEVQKARREASLRAGPEVLFSKAQPYVLLWFHRLPPNTPAHRRGHLRNTPQKGRRGKSDTLS